MKIVISLIIAITIHLALLFAGNAVYKPPEVYMQPGESAIEMTLVASIESPESKKTEIPEEIVEEKPIVQTETEPEIVDVVEEPEIEPDSLLKAGKEVAPKIEKKDTTAQKEPEPEQPVIKEEAVKQDNIPETKSDENSNAVPSTEIVADMRDKGITAPSVNGVKKPKYPSSCRKKGHEGVCVLEATIDAKGNCVEVAIVQTAGCSKLDKSAITVLKKAKFSPAEQFGIKIKGSKKMGFKFRIEDVE